MKSYARRCPALLIILIGLGCSSARRQAPPQSPPIVGRGTPAVLPKPLGIADQPISPARPSDDIEDRNLLIPPPPSLREMAKSPVAKEKAVPEIALTSANDSSMPSNKPNAKQTGTLAGVGIGEESNSGRMDKDEALTAIKTIHRNALIANAKMDCYETRLTRRESINGKAVPQEIIAFKFRKNPYSVRLKWLGQEGQGREVVYVQGQYAGKMYVMPTKQDSFPLPPMRMSFMPDDSMVRSKTRHDIREAGLGESIKHLGETLDLIAKNPAQRNRLRYLGLVTRPEFVSPMEGIEETIPPRTEPLLPSGGKRVTFYDTGAQSVSKDMPVLVIAHDAANKEVEYYCFDRFLFPITLNNSDFDPEQIWKKK